MRRVSPGKAKALVDRVDLRLTQMSGALPDSLADASLKMLGMAANHSVLWCGVAAGLAARKGPSRRAGLRGVCAIGAASVLASFVTKRLIPRRRPAATLVPSHRRLIDRPSSSSFPSGHAASAAAFTTAVALESPLLGATVLPLAAAVVYSRVHTGVHWPSDVASGAALGTAVGLATRHWWPVRPGTPSMVRHADRAAALEDGDGMVILVNTASGDPDHDPTEELGKLWPSAKLVHPSGEGDLAVQLDTALRSGPDHVRALGVAGGDGTVATVAAVAAEHDLPLVVVPAGTLNHFGRDVGVSDAGKAADAVTDGSAIRVGLGTVCVDGRSPQSFVNTASLGGYPDMVKLRERWEKRWGKWPAAAAALVRVLAKAEPIRVRLDGLEHRFWLLFVGNNGYQPKGFAPAWRPRLDDGTLDIRSIRADVRFSRARFVLAALSGALTRSRTYVQYEARQALIEILDDEPVALACDGEVHPEGSQFAFGVQQKALRVYRPRQEAGV